ncbi:MAG: ribonuclease E/G, partial [Pseudomonadota bacterium]
MGKLMLIDAAHPEETRVAVVTDQQVDDFDFETQGKEQLRGNIYLAKVTRVEPSLQAAFVEYGGNRHGFLAFSEIHPDYYELPKADRDALLKEAAEEAAASADDDDDDDFDEDSDLDDDDEAENDASDDDDEEDDDDEDEATAEASDETDADVSDDVSGDGDDENGEGNGKAKSKAASRGRGPVRKKRPPRNSFLRKYKIQEVIRRRQVMLVQVAKEERGNKGAALTTYLSLAGRYSVLMPNTPRGGGISRKIANGADRKRLKSIVGELDMADGMGLIVRTAGAKRTKTDIKRDYDYLIKLWNQIREKTLTSMAPCLINAEGGLVHRAMRDMFDKEIEEVLIQGEHAYREAKDLAKMIMPSQARKVKHWTDPVPVFVDHGIDEQLDSIFKPEVRLKSGGYLVINQTEALVAIDVNSGKATKERNIEQTALRTNLEAAEEACRQMRLRDLAGLVVIDFIDMDENKHNRAIEKAMKQHLTIDRARVQCGRISQFGLMEISRQRRRAGFLQATSDPCPACNGTGRVRSVESAALQLLRAIEARAATGGLKSITVEAPTDVALYLLNHKRDKVAAIEEVAGFAITVTSSDTMLAGDFTLHAERDPNAKQRPKKNRRKTAPPDPQDTISDLDVIDDEDEDDTSAEDTRASTDGEGDEDGTGKRKRRRRGR